MNLVTRFLKCLRLDTHEVLKGDWMVRICIKVILLYKEKLTQGIRHD